MTVLRLQKPEWQPFFDNLSRRPNGTEATIEIDSLRLGERVQAEAVPLIGILDDPNDDFVEAALERLDRMIRDPLPPQMQGRSTPNRTIKYSF